MPYQHDRTRSAIAATAARLILENGADYALAKRKALRQLGLADSVPLPSDDEVDAALHDRIAIFADDAQAANLLHLRRKAAELMALLADFRPYLTGPVLDGTAGRYSAIDLQLFADSAKEVEIFLLNRQFPYEHLPPPGEPAEAALALDIDGGSARLLIYPTVSERHAPKGRHRQQRRRARLAELSALLAETAPGAAEPPEPSDQPLAE